VTHTFPEPHPWPHSPHPVEVRRANDGRVALRFALRDSDYKPFDAWLVFSAPNGFLQVDHLSADNAPDDSWTHLEMP